MSISDGVSVVDNIREPTEFQIDLRGDWITICPPSGWAADSWFAADLENPVFEISPTGEPEGRLRMVHLTDIHVDLDAPLGQPMGLQEFGDGPLSSSLLIEQFRSYADRSAADVVIITGDLSDHGTVREFELVKKVLSHAFAMPCLLIPGNHDHYGHLYTEVAAEPVDVMLTADTSRYTSTIGPRWWARWVGGLHFIALDWFSYRLGMDNEVQHAWLNTHLSRCAPGTPVCLLTHDLFPRGFYRRLKKAHPHVDFVGSLSGHWHVSRIVKTDGWTHVNTGTAGFGGLDLTPPQGRLVIWDGDGLNVASETVSQDDLISGFFGSAEAEASDGSEDFRWITKTGGLAHLSTPRLVGNRIVLTLSDEDVGQGWLVSFGVDDGEEVWRHRLGSIVRAGALISENAAIVSLQDGSVQRHSLVDGELLWRQSLADPCLSAIIRGGTMDGDVYFGGDQRVVHALDLASGDVLWLRNDLGRAENLLTYGSPKVISNTVLFPLGGPGCRLVALDRFTGKTLWRDDETSGFPTSGIAESGPHCLMTTSRGTLRVFDPQSGRTVAEVRLGAEFPSPAPVIIGDQIIVSTAAGRIVGLDARDLTVAWTQNLPGKVPGIGPYRASSQALVVPALVVGDVLVQVTAGGIVFIVDPADGSLLHRADLRHPVTSEALALENDLVLATCDGLLLRMAVPFTR